MTVPRGLPQLSRTTLQLPVKGSAAHWSYGTAVIGRPGTSEVLLTLPSAAARTPWARVDVGTGALGIGSAMPGPLRSAYFPGAGEDPRWWVLGLYGVGRVRPDQPSAVHDVVRAGIGRYPRRMFSLGPAHVAVGTDLSGNVVLLSKESGQPVGRLRLPRGSISLDLDDGLVRVFAPEQGMVHDVDPVAMKVRRRHTIPPGKGARLVGETLHYLAGDVEQIRILRPGEVPRPGVPVVLGAGAGRTVGSTVVPRRLLGLHGVTLEVAGVEPEPGAPVVPAAVEVLGADAQGNLAVGTQQGFALVAPDSGTVLAEHVEAGGLVGAGMVQGHSTVVLATRGAPRGTLALVSW